MFKNVITRPRSSAHVLVHGHSFAVRGMTGNGCPNLASFPLNLTANDRLISLIDAPAGELVRERQVRIVILRDDQATACVFIQSVNDTRPRDTANPTQFSTAMMKQRVHERVFL